MLPSASTVQALTCKLGGSWHKQLSEDKRSPLVKTFRSCSTTSLLSLLLPAPARLRFVQQPAVQTQYHAVGKWSK